MATIDARGDIVTAAKWCVRNKSLFHYEEVRPFGLYRPTFTHPIVNDCSATFTLCYWLAGVIDDPTGLHYSGYGNTDSLVSHGTSVSSGAATHPGDAVIYYSAGATVHVALVIEPGDDPLTMSHGGSTEPGFIHVSQDGRPHRYFTFNTQKPAPPTPPPVPTEEDMVVLVKNPHNGGIAILDLSTGKFYGLSNPAVLAFYEACGVKHGPDPSVAVWDKFSQAGTI